MSAQNHILETPCEVEPSGALTSLDMRAGVTANPMNLTKLHDAQGTLNREEQLGQYAPLVRRLAQHLIAKLPASVEIDDLIQVGMIGLTEAISRFEPAQGVKFETFASLRIRGAMLDELRGGDWMSRVSRKSQKDIEQAVHRLQQKLHRAPIESEIAKELCMTLTDYQHLLTKVCGTQLVYLEDMRGHGDDDEEFFDRHVGDLTTEPSSCLQDQRMRKALVAAIKVLPQREQHIMSMYYEHDMNLREIAAVLGVGEARICQLRSQSIARLRACLREH